MLLCLVAVVVSGRLCAGQPGSPVYPDDSPSASAALSATAGMVASGNADEAVRTLGRLLESEGDRVVASADDEALFVSVRGAVHGQLLAMPELMTRYRAAYAARAGALLDEGRIEEVERVYLMTSAGYEAALRLCQQRLEAARFNAAFLTLVQLEAHPDRAGDAGAAMLARQIARYVPREEVAALAKRWTTEAGVDAVEVKPFDRPALADVRVLTPMAGGEALIAEQIPPKPMWTVRLENDGSLVMRGTSMRGPRERRPGLWTYPTIADDVLLVNDTVWVRAWDRYTLEPLWRVKPGVDGPTNAQMLGEAWEQRIAPTVGHVQIEDTNSVAVWANVAVTATGFAKDSNRFGDGRVHGIDVRSGETLWSASPGAGGGPLDQGSVRGPVMVDEGMAVVSVRRSARTRRVVSFSLAGIDALSGEILWTRPIGSAGALPFANDRRIANSSVMDRGVVYASDQMGVMAAVEAQTGRPIWVRRLGVSEIASGTRTSAWESMSAIVHGDVVYMLTPTRDRIVAMDRLTGAVVSSRTADRFDSPQYVIEVGDYLAAVGGRRIAFVPFEAFASGTIRLSERFVPTEIRGRVVAAGGMLYVPTDEGVVEIDPANPRVPTRVIALDYAGTILPAGEQIVVVDDHAVHAYVSWAVADRVLQGRMDAEPGLAAPAVSYADLAYRVGRVGRIVPAVDRAIEALAMRPDEPANVAARGRLFASLHSMAQGWLASPRELSETGDEAKALEAVTERLGLVARSDGQRVEYLLVRGRVLEVQGAFEEAATAYGEILENEPLAAVERDEDGRLSSAGWAATRALRGLVLDHGLAAHAGIDARATRAEPGAGVGAEVLTAFARVHPTSRAAARAWVRAAKLYGEMGQSGAQIASLRRGLLGSEIVFSLEPGSDLRPIEEAGGGLVRALVRVNREAEAAQILARLLADYPSLTMAKGGGGDGGGEGVAGVEVLGELKRAVSLRGARIGSVLTGEAQSIVGWTIMPTLVEDGDRGTSHMVLRSATQRAFSLWGPIEAAPNLRGRALNPDGPGSLAMLWSRTFLDFEPAIVRVDPGAVYLLWASPRGGVIEKVRAFDGETLWRTDAFDTLFKPDGAFASRLTTRLRQPIMFSTPNNVRRLIAELVVAADSASVVMVERSGRLAVFDPQTGALVRTQVSAVQTVIEVDVSNGVVALVGSAQQPNPDSGRVAVDPAVEVFDARTGERIATSAPVSGMPSWVRVADDDTIVVGAPDSIACVEIATGETRWSASAALGDDAAGSTKVGWVFGETVYLLGASGQLTARSLEDGSLLGAGPLMGGGRFGRTDIRAHRVSEGVGEGRVAFVGGGGLVVVDGGGVVVGMDSIDASRRVGIVRPAVGVDRVVMVERATVGDAMGRGINRVHVISSETGALLGSRDVALIHPPTRVSLLDGRVAISTASMTVVYGIGDAGSGGQR
jgi:outer membrane protein assembly factor BamB/tetratricopeptide (TPR) repeat protein